MFRPDKLHPLQLAATSPASAAVMGNLVCPACSLACAAALRVAPLPTGCRLPSKAAWTAGLRRLQLRGS